MSLTLGHGPLSGDPAAESYATWWSLADGPDDVAWGYDEPLPEGLGLADHLAFSGADATVEVVAG